MYTRLHSLLATGRRVRRLLGAALGAGLLLGAAPAAEAQTLYGLGTVNAGPQLGAQGLITINLATGFTNTLSPTPIIYAAVTGLPLVGMDFRPATGVLYALGYDNVGSAQLYTVNQTTGVATAVAAPFALVLGGATDRIGFDFNPAADRIRVVSTTGANVRLNPITGGLAVTDTNLTYAAGDANAGTTPRVGSGAYTNSVSGAAPLNTLLYDLDELNNGNTSSGFLTTQNPPNSGFLNTVGPLLLGAFTVGLARNFDLDIYFNPTTGQNVAYLEEVNVNGGSNLYTLNLETGQATLVGNTVPASGTFEIRDIAAQPSATLSTSGQMIYAVSGGQLVSFLSDSPSLLRFSVAFGAPNAGETVVGIDFRPATGQLFALGYDASATSARLYTVSLTTGALTAVGAGPITGINLGTTTDRIGFDFNPTVDRIRVVSTNRGNFRLNPVTGGLAFTDGQLTAGPVISAAAYTNNQSIANSTVLYDYDATNANLYVQNPPNSGGLVLTGGSGLTPPTAPRGADFDIFNVASTSTNTAFLSVNAGASPNDRLYTVDLATGAATLKETIGSGGDVLGLAVFISTASGTGITWTGLVSTDWGTAGNWSSNTVPTANNDVTIPGGTPNQPTVSNAQQARFVTLTTGAVLTTANGGTLTAGGSFTNNGGSLAGSGTGVVVLSGTAIQTVGGTSLSAFNNLTVGTAAANTSGPVAIVRGLVLNGNLTVGSGSPFVAQTLTLLSSAAGTAYVVNNAFSVTNAVTVQRYITPTNAGLGYRHYSSPVSGNTVADFATTGYAPEVSQAAAYNGAADPTQVSITPFPNIFKYTEARVTTNVPANGSRDFDRGFEVPAGTGEALDFARGYTVNITGSALVDFVGALNNAPTGQTVGGLGRGGLPQSGWHLRGNPFPSALDWAAVVAGGRTTSIENALYVFKSSGQYTGTYTSYVNGQATNSGSNVLPVGQGFFVRTAAGQTGSITFSNADRLASYDNTLFQRGAADLRPRLTLALGNATARTQAVMYFEQGATAGFDRAFDAHALPAPNGLTLATEAGAESLAINGRPALTGADVLLPLRLNAVGTGSFTLQVDALDNVPATYRVYLRDALTGAYTDLATAQTIAVQPGAASRYAVLFTTQARVLATAPAALAQLASVYPNPATGAATLLLPAALSSGQATAVAVLDNLGRVVLARTLAAGTQTLELPLAALAPGVYAVQARTAAGLVVKRLVVE